MRNDYMVPFIGTTLDLEKPDEVLQAYEDVNQALAMLADAKRQLTQVLVEHSKATGRRTVTVPGGARYERTGGPQTSYGNPAEIERKLLAEGMPEARVREIVVTTIDKKVDGRQAAMAARANPAYKAILDEHAVTVEKPYRISPK